MKGRMPDDLWTGLEVLERRAFGHNQTLVCYLSCLKQSSSDKALEMEYRFSRANRIGAIEISEIVHLTEQAAALIKKHGG